MCVCVCVCVCINIPLDQSCFCLVRQLEPVVRDVISDYGVHPLLQPVGLLRH